MRKQITSAHSGHTFTVESIDRADLPAQLECSENYTIFYAVRHWGVTHFYLGKGDKDAPKQIVVWYQNGRFWSSFGLTFKEAIEGAQRDGWLYATKREG